MSEEMINEVEATEESESLDNPVEEYDELETATDDTPEAETQAEESEPETDTLLDWFNSQNLKVDGEEFSYKSRDQILDDARSGRTVPRLIEQRDKYKNDPGYKFMQNYMKDSGYKDMNKFVHDLQVTQKANDLVSKGMNEEAAKEAAEEFVSNRAPSADPREAEIAKFQDWHESKFGEPLKETPDYLLEAFDKGMSLKEAYLEHKLDSAKVETQQETLKALKENKEKSSGDLAKGQSKQPDPTISQVDKLMEKMSSKQRTAYFDKNDAMLDRIGYFNR